MSSGEHLPPTSERHVRTELMISWGSCSIQLEQKREEELVGLMPCRAYRKWRNDGIGGSGSGREGRREGEVKSRRENEKGKGRRENEEGKGREDSELTPLWGGTALLPPGAWILLDIARRIAERVKMTRPA